MIEVTRRYRFPAAHVLASNQLSAEENDEIFGKCANPNGHGHNYGVDVTVTGDVDERTGQIVPIEKLDAIFDRAVREPLAYQMLNDLAPFADRVPTAENIAVVVHELLDAVVAEQGSARLLRVRVVETPRNYFDYGDIT